MPKLYMIGNTHFDPVWEWTWDEAMSSIRATFRSALDRMKEYPDFCYSFSSAPVFEWIRKTDPKMFEEIKQRIKENRWDLAEGWFNQPDCFSALGESYVRQGLYGQGYLKENFGKYSECAFNTDSFGHPDMLPQILLKSGIKYYCLCRPEQPHYPLEQPLFKWKSRDGSCVSAFRIGGAAGEGWAKNTAEAMEAADALSCNSLVVYGVTDHGGAPTKRSIEQIYEKDNAVFSTVKGYFEAQNDISYVIEDEFITGDFGVYSNNTEIKSLNRTAEYALLNAEKSCVIANADCGAELSKCWRDVLFNQFHDILGGASIKEAYTDARNLYGRALQTAGEIMHYNLQSITAKICMPGKNPDNVWNLVVWNLNPCKFDGYIEAEVQWAHEFDWYDKGITLEDEHGVRTRTQIICEHAAIPRFRSRFIFKAEILPMGYKCFKVIRNEEAVEKKPQEDITRAETDSFIFTIKNGAIESVFDKRSGTVAAEKLFFANCYEDNGDAWCFNIDSYGEKMGGFRQIKSELIESGELIDKIKITLKYENSLLYMYYTFYKRENYFDVDYTVNWAEAHTVLKFDCMTNADFAAAATPYSSMKREKSRLDRPMGEWIKTDKLTFLTKSCFAYNFYDDTLGFTVLRSPVYGDFRLGELLDKDYPVTEQGITVGAFRVVLSADINENDAAVCFNNRPIVVCESNHDGILKSEHSFISLNAENVYLGAVKHAEDKSGIIFRAVNTASERRIAELNVFGEKYTFSLEAFEIKTMKLTDGELFEVDMLENKI